MPGDLVLSQTLLLHPGPGIHGAFPGLWVLPHPWHHALPVSPSEDVFQNDSLDKDVADLHRKLRGETHYQIRMIDQRNYEAYIVHQLGLWCQ